jgi:hypothetical protein
MSEKVNPDLFARLMGLSHPARRDLLEFMGETPIEEAELERLINEIAQKGKVRTPPKPS